MHIRYLLPKEFDQGHIIEEAPPEILFTDPKNGQTKTFLSKII